MDKHATTAKPVTLFLAAVSPAACVGALLLWFGAGSLPV
jgi:hypothetical protein